MAEIAVPVLALAANIIFGFLNTWRNHKLDRKAAQEAAERNQTTSREIEPYSDPYNSSESEFEPSSMAASHQNTGRKTSRRKKRGRSARASSRESPLSGLGVFTPFIFDFGHTRSEFPFCNGKVKRLNVFSFFYTTQSYYWCTRCGQDVIVKLPAKKMPHVEFCARDGVRCQLRVRYLAKCHGVDITRFGCRLCGFSGTLDGLMEHLGAEHTIWELRKMIDSKNFVVLEQDSRRESLDGY